MQEYIDNGASLGWLIDRKNPKAEYLDTFVFLGIKTMTEAQLTATKIPVNNLIDMLAAIGNRDYSRFQELEQVFVSQYGEEVWQEVFNFRVLPALDKPTSQWLLAQWMSHGINGIKKIA